MASNYVTGFHFSLLIVPKLNEASIALSVASAILDAAFHEVSGLSKEISTEDVVCGGENRFKYSLPGMTSSGKLVLKRGKVLNVSPLAEWCKSTLDGSMSEPIETKDLVILLLNQIGVPCMAWHFIGAYPVKWSGSDLNSDKNAVFIETIEMAYQYFELDDGSLGIVAAAAALAAEAASALLKR